MNTLDFILDKYGVRDVKSPVKLNCTRWGTLPKLFKQLGFKLGAEVGVAGGRFSKFLAMYNPGCKIYSIDAWEVYPGYKDNESQDKMEELYLEARKRLAPFNCQVIRDWSMSAVKRFEDGILDFVYIDSNHDYEHVKEDIREWSKKVKPGGIVAGHDYINGLHGFTYGVKQAVNEWVEENQISHLFILTKRADVDNCPSWMYVK